jgi:AcrR family transcriptional regulator
MREGPTGEKGKRRKAGELRSDILAAAREVFTERGYAASSTREIAERAKAAEPLIFRHFDRKTKLFAAAVFDPIEQTLERQFERLRDMYDSPLPPEQGIRNYVEAVLHTVRANKRLFVAYMNAITFHSDDFSELWEINAPPSFQEVLRKLELSSSLRPDSRIIIHDRHFELRIILLFLFSVGLFDDLFFAENERNEPRIVESVIKLLTMGVGVGKGESAMSSDLDPSKTEQAELLARLRSENEQLRGMLVERMLEINELRRSGPSNNSNDKGLATL